MKCLHFHTISQKSFQWRHPVVLVFLSHRLQMWCFDLFFFFSPPCCVQFELQKLRIYCDPEQSNRETACEIPGVVSTKSCFALHSFTFVV